MSQRPDKGESWDDWLLSKGWLDGEFTEADPEKGMSGSVILIDDAQNYDVSFDESVYAPRVEIGNVPAEQSVERALDWISNSDSIPEPGLTRWNSGIIHLNIVIDGKDLAEAMKFYDSLTWRINE